MRLTKIQSLASAEKKSEFFLSVMRKNRFIPILLSCLFALSQPLTARYNEGKVNLRESCREQISGEYLRLHDKVEKSRTLIAYLKDQVKKLSSAIKQTEIELKQLQKKEAQEKYDLKLTHKLRGVHNKLRTLKASLKEAKSLRQKNSDISIEMHSEKELFFESAKSVFRIKNIDGKGYGYKFILDFKNTCPQFRIACPLPAELAKKLKRMQFSYFELPEDCRRYSTYLQKSPRSLK